MIEIENNIESAFSEDDFQSELKSLDKTHVELAKQMQSWGDHRSFQTILRSIQRMASGATTISGEMRVIVNMMLYQQYLDEIKYADLKWRDHSNGNVSNIIDDFTITLKPETKGRWSISIIHKNGYSHTWPSWQNSLDAAKRKALITLNDAKRHVVEYERDIRLNNGTVIA